MKRAYGRKRGVFLAVVFAIAAFVLLSLLYLGGRWLETRQYGSEPRGEYRPQNEYEPAVHSTDVSYQRRKGLTTILLMGVEREGGGKDGAVTGFLQLLVLDAAEKKITQFRINCDTMVTVSASKDHAELRSMRISQVYGLGEDEEQSCALTVEAVSDFLLGIPIDYYIVVHLDSIDAINDLLGGVTLTLEDDLSFLDPAMTKGKTLTLTGEQAKSFVCGHVAADGETNESRMRRQNAFVQGLLDRLKETQSNALGRLYADISDYLSTNLSYGTMINGAIRIQSYAYSAPILLEGSYSVGADGHTEYRANEDSLYQSVSELFFRKEE